MLKTERFNKRCWNQTKWYSINYQRLEVLNKSICSNQSHRSTQIEQLDVVSLSSSSTETTASTTSKTTSFYSQEREQEKQIDKTVIARSCTSPVADNKMASKEPINLGQDRFSADGDHVQNEFDASPCIESPALKSDLSASV